MLTDEQIKNIFRETSFKTSRSGGKGGQNVNKLETKVEIEFNVSLSESLTISEKEIILSKYAGITDDGAIKLVSSEHRTQLENKEEVKKKLVALLNKLLKPVKKRYATKPSRSSKLKKLDSKKKRGETKNLRKKIF
ncbi:MAG: aminoacyl-tRNA hydrolase [Bacteroidetes bacterium]|nr:aminoacyl-tRNA hydrolase [Bacteroidota bacterium]